MTPEQLAKANTEHAHQVALMAWCAINFRRLPKLKLLFAIPNGGERNPIVAARMKAEGVRSGVPDLMLPVARHGMHGLFIEMKKPRTGTVSEKQDQWHNDLRGEGFAVAVCYGWQEAVECLERWFT